MKTTANPNALQLTPGERVAAVAVGAAIGTLMLADIFTHGKVHEGIMRTVEYAATFLPGGAPSAPLPSEMSGPGLIPGAGGDVM